MPPVLVGQAGIAGVSHPSPQTITYTSTAGNTLIIVAHIFNGTPASTLPVTITDTASNTWQFSTSSTAGNPAVPPSEENAAGNAADWVAYVIHAAAVTSVTVTAGGSANFWRIALTEWSGISGFSNSFAAQGAASLSFAQGPVQLVSPGALLVGAASSGSGTPALPSGWTQFTASGGAVGYLIPNGTGGGFSATWSTSSSSAWEGVMAAFTVAGGQVQPLASQPARRRILSRAVSQSPSVAGANAAPVAGIAGTVQPLATLAIPRRPPARAVVQFVPVTTVNTGHGPAGSVQPLATFPTPRRRPSRVVTGFIPVATVNKAAGPAGTVQPLAVPAAMPRRKISRAAIQFIPVATVNNPHPPVPKQPPTGGGKSMLSRYMRWADL